MSASDGAPPAAVLFLDTSAAIEQRQVEAWRRMSPAQKLQLVSDATLAVISQPGRRGALRC